MSFMPAYCKAFKKFKLQNHPELETDYIYQKVKNTPNVSLLF